jgi:hypothetical protein
VRGNYPSIRELEREERASLERERSELQKETDALREKRDAEHREFRINARHVAWYCRACHDVRGINGPRFPPADFFGEGI